MKKYAIIFFVFFGLISNEKNDLNIVGNAFFSDGLGRLPISLIHTLQDNLKINYIPIHERKDYIDVPQKVRNIILNSKGLEGPVSILFSAPYYIGGTPYKLLPNNTIKLAYSMLEASEIPYKWVQIFNKYFDAVIVPDEFLVDVYTHSGVKIPIFILPCILMLDEFLKEPLPRNFENKTFTFGISAAYGIEKNHDILIDAFAKEFKNKPDVKLKIHGRWGNSELLSKKIKDLNLNNIELIQKVFSHAEYIEFLKSLNCYVLLSRGEGFSITPREALALGIPCILTYHTAHKTICDAGVAVPVKAEIKTPIYYSIFDSDCGYQLTCNVKDAQIALKEIYENYRFYLNKNKAGREWVKRYLPENLKKKYLNLFRPSKILFGKKNLVTDNFFMTNSRKLFNKYCNKFKFNNLKSKLGENE